jgi:hypothetical protein
VREQPPAPKHLADPPAPADDSLDLGATVLPVLAKSYWKPAAGALGVLLLLWWVVSRSRR